MTSAAPTGLHQALVCHEGDDLVAQVGAAVHAGLAAGEETRVALAPERLGPVREWLGADADATEFIDADVFYRRLGPLFSGLGRELEERAGAGRPRLRLVAEPPVRAFRPAEARAHLRWEAALNVVYARCDISLLCLYDAQGLSEAALGDVRCTHPELLSDGHGRRSAAFLDPAVFLSRRAPGLQAAPAGDGRGWGEGGVYALDEVRDLAGVRAAVRARAAAAGMAPAAAVDLVTAVSEIAANAIAYADAPRTLRVAVQDGVLVCRVRDAGPGIGAPFAGFLTPTASAEAGRGIWLANQLVDVVEIASGPAGTEVILEVVLARPAA